MLAQPNTPTPAAEEVVEGVIVGGGDTLKVDAGDGGDRSEDEMAGDEVDFEVENGQDGDKAIEFSRTLKIEWIPANVEFWFTNIENEMFTCEVKSQWLK